jgi:uncharacterized protein (DUF1330 family)
MGERHDVSSWGGAGSRLVPLRAAQQNIAIARARPQDQARSAAGWRRGGSNGEEGAMAAYWMARAKIIDPVAYKKYTDQVPEILAKYGGKVLARGGDYQIMEGPEHFERFIVIEFPSMEQAVACNQSPEYQAAAEHRRNGAGEVEQVIVEGA